MYGPRAMPACFDCHSMNRPRRYNPQNDVDFLSELRNLEKELYYAKVERPLSDAGETKRREGEIDSGYKLLGNSEANDKMRLKNGDNKTEGRPSTKMNSLYGQETKKRTQNEDKTLNRTSGYNKKIAAEKTRMLQRSKTIGVSANASRYAYRENSSASIHEAFVAQSPGNVLIEDKKVEDAEAVHVSPKITYFDRYSERWDQTNEKKPAVYGTWETRDCMFQSLRNLDSTIQSLETLRQVGPRSEQNFFDEVIRSLKESIGQLSDLQYRYDHDANTFQKNINQYWFSK